MLEKLLAKHHIRHLDLLAVRLKAIDALGWNADRAGHVEGDYKRFLYALAHKGREDVLSPPSHDVDEFWHQHILDTRKYREDCDLIFGHYLDHTPGLDEERQRKADTRRREIYERYDIDAIDFDSSDSYDAPVHRQDSILGLEGHHADGGHGGDSCHDASGHACDSGGGTGGDGGGGGGDGGGGGCGGGGCGGS